MMNRENRCIHIRFHRSTGPSYNIRKINPKMNCLLWHFRPVHGSKDTRKKEQDNKQGTYITH